ncbi:MAG: FtsH protease modulator YccA, partial [Candidatus Competibacterales bacterium]|nr:FtsH protease modulator YccA [Candidatus Competibacterales bacterium]
MAHRDVSTVTGARQESLLATHKVLRNTYMLLSLTLLFSGLTAAFAVVTNAPSLGLFSLLIYFGLFFLTAKLRNSVWGIVSVFALTGFLG